MSVEGVRRPGEGAQDEDLRPEAEEHPTRRDNGLDVDLTQAERTAAEDPEEGLDPATLYRLEEARKATERGWPLTPLDGKVPTQSAWQKRAAPKLAQVEKWALKGNVGLRTGVASGVVVLDDDTEDASGTASLDLPTTVTVITGSGKRHLYFKEPEGGLTNARGQLPNNVDVRGTGGQVAFVGAVHPETGGIYCWAGGLSPDEVELAELPLSVLELIRSPNPKKEKAAKRAKRRSPAAVDQSADDALAKAASAVASASEGERNKTLNTEAFRMSRWIAVDLLKRDEVERALTEAAKAVGLDDEEIRKTARSGLDAGLNQPLRHRQSADDDAPGANPKPSIMLEGGALPSIVQQAENALLTSGARLYQRGSVVVRAMRSPAATIRDVYRRAEGILMLREVDAPYLVEVLTRAASWYRPSRDDLVLVDCPERIARTYLARAGHWRLPQLIGVIETPTLRPDGSILATPGYDPATCLLYEPGSVRFPEIPDEPSTDDALRALAVLKWIIKDFPWVEECDRSAALVAILTVLIRRSLRTAPLIAYRAPKMASGKSLLADVVAMIATGRVASVMSQGKDEDEDKKRMLAILMEGISVACIDNIERDFGGATLCSVLTQESWRERILGRTGTATVPTSTTWLATGNNIRFVGDIVTRVVPCDLDAMMERPEEREFEVDLHDYVPAHRPELVVAGLTILRAYHVAGRPNQGLSVFGRFEEWSDWVRSALVWLGEEDPCAGRVRLYDYDPVASQLRALLSSWHDELGKATYTAAEVIQRAAPVDTSLTPSALHEALMGVAARGAGKPEANRLGWYLSKYERRAEASLRIERMGERQGVALWRVADLAGGRGRESVGFEGLVGQSGPFGERSASAGSRVQGGGAHGAEERREGGSQRRPAGNDPRNPPTPRGVAANPPNEAAEVWPDGAWGEL